MAGVEITFPGGRIAFDATIREGHAGTSTVTEHAVEIGANITDHVRPQLNRFECDVFVTNAPIRLPGSQVDGITADQMPMTIKVKQKGGLPIGIPGVGAAIAGAGLLDQDVEYNPVVLQFSDAFDRPKSVYEALEDLRVTATLITISTRFREYTDMIIDELSAPRNASDGDAVTFSLKAKQMLFAETAIVAVSVTATTKSAQPKTSKGPQPAAPVDNESVLHKAKEAATKFSGLNG